MNQQTSNLITQALVLLIGAIFTYYQQHRAKVDAVVKDNQAAKTALDVVNKTADFVVHKLEAGDLDNEKKQAQAVKVVQSTLQTLGLPAISDEVIVGAVESAVSAMHLAYSVQEPIKKDISSTVIKAKIDMNEVTKALKAKQAELNAKGTTTDTSLNESVDLSADEQAGGGPMNG